MTRLLSLFAFFLFLGCSAIVEIAQKPDVIVVSEKETVRYADPEEIHDTIFAAGSSYMFFRERNDIEIIESEYWVDDGIHKVKYRYLIGEISSYGYEIKIENVGSDTAFNVKAFIATNKGDRILLERQMLLRDESASISGVFEAGVRASGSANVDFNSYQ